VGAAAIRLPNYTPTDAQTCSDSHIQRCLETVSLYRKTASWCTKLPPVASKQPPGAQNCLPLPQNCLQLPQTVSRYLKTASWCLKMPPAAQNCLPLPANSRLCSLCSCFSSGSSFCACSRAYRHCSHCLRWGCFI